MKITAIIAAAPDLGNAVCDALRELGDEVARFDLSGISFSFWSEDFNAGIDAAYSAVKDADGVVFAFSGLNGLPDARLVAFLEYARTYGRALAGKNCFIAGDSRRSVSVVSDWLFAAGAADAARAIAGEADLTEGSAVFENVGRAAEDFYRIVRQRRKVVSPGGIYFGGAVSENAPPAAPRREADRPKPAAVKTGEERQMEIRPEEARQEEARPEETSPAEIKPAPLKIERAEILERHEPRTDAARRDVAEIAGLYAKKFEVKSDAPVETGMVETERPKPAPKPTVQTCARLTKALTYHYKGDALTAAASFQFHIDGDGGFDGVISVQGQDCRFSEGTHESPDVTILSDGECWREVLRGKVSAMKAFMVGRLKVRGNFVLLKRFDELFDFCVS